MLPKLRHQSDRRTLWALGLAGATLLYSLSWREGMLSALVLFILNVFLGLLVHVINHNASHHPIFKRERHNDWAFFYLSWLMGIPAAPIAASHIHNHHVHNNNQSDWMRSTVLGGTRGANRLAKYLLHVFTLPKLSMRSGNGNIPRSLWVRMRTETKIVAFLLCLMFALNPLATILFYVLSRLTSMSLLFLINLVQHDGLENDLGVNRCRNFVSPLGNFLMFNNGFHSAHHLRPGAHWSEYSAIHQSLVASELRDELMQRSLFAYIFKQYLWV